MRESYQENINLNISSKMDPWLASDRQGSTFESCVWKAVSSHSSHHPQEVLLAQLSLQLQQ